MVAAARLACPGSHSGRDALPLSELLSGFAPRVSGLNVELVRVRVRRYPGHHSPPRV